MKALVLREFGKHYQVSELEKPVAGDREVLIKISASGVNPLDLKIKDGQAPHARTTLPAILGIDAAGTVESAGKSVNRFREGDMVYGMIGGIAGVQGSLAEYAAVDADLIAKMSGNLSTREASVVPLIFITAWEALVDRARVEKGKTVLIHGGIGGVGHIAIQLAVAMGATVFSTVKPAYNEQIIHYGAAPIDYTRYSVDDYIKEFTGGEGFDVILDTIGGENLDQSFKAAKQYTGHVVSILGWGTHHLAPLSFRGATYSGVFTLYPLISGKGRAHHGEILSEATRLIESGQVKPLLDSQTYTALSIEDAYHSIVSKKSKGKIAVDMIF